MATIKYIVYEHVLDVVFSVGPANITADDIASSLSEEIKVKIRAFVNPLISELKNRLPSLPLTKATLNNAPFDIMPLLRHILMKYESLIEQNPQIQPHLISQSQPISQPQPLFQDKRRPKKKKKTKSGKKKKSQERKFTPPRLFCLFPEPSLRWKFIKIDGQNLTGVFPEAKLPNQREKPNYDLTLRTFLTFFNFAKLNIHR